MSTFEDEETLSDVPPLVIVSTRVKQYGSLVQLANPGVAIVVYDYERTSLSRLLQLIGEKLQSRKALSIALVLHGQPGIFKLNRHNNVSRSAFKEDTNLQSFFKDLIGSFLNTTGVLARVDILNCPVEQNTDGIELIKAINNFIGVPIYSSEDILGPCIEGGEHIGALYFDGQKLKEWSATPNTMKLEAYERIRTVGKGAYGQAILYRRKEDDSQVILKQINILELNKVERQNVVNEIKILSMLDHPHIVSYYDNFEEDGLMMIEMEFADGGSLQQYLKQQQSFLPELEILTKFSQMVDALNFVHKNNILHRDLKTANVFLTRHGMVKLGDFGIAKVLSATQEAAHTVVGTPYYISPEICEGKQYDSKSDIWSLGCILHEMVCLERPFDGTNLPALVHKIVEGSFEPVKGKFSDELKQLIQRLLQKDPQRRPGAADLYSHIIPPLLHAIQVKEGILQLPEQIQIDDKDIKSFLYYMNWDHLSFSPINCTLQQERITHVAIGYGHMVAVTCDTCVYSWGDNTHGQCGHGDTVYRSVPNSITSLKGKNIKRVECGGEFSIFKNENGIIMSCGRGDKGVLGHGNIHDYHQPEIIQSLLAYDSHLVSCGESHVCVLTLDHKVFTWGSGKHGCLGTGSEENCTVPCEIVLRSPGSPMDERGLDIRCGMDSTVFITEMGRVFACGNNCDNKIGLNKRETFLMHMKKKLSSKHQLQVPYCLRPTPIKELGKHRVIDCSLGSTHSAFLTDTGLVYTFGRNNEGQLGSGNCLPREMAAIVKGLKDQPMMVTSSELATIVATESNTFHIWGSRPIIASPLSTLLSNDRGSGSQDFIDPQSNDVLSQSWIGSDNRTVSCDVASDYITSLYNLLPSEDGNISRQTSQPQISSTGKKKGHHSSQDLTDIILKPVTIDLEKGTLRKLWDQGLKEVKLEGMSSFGCNIVILLHAHIPIQSDNQPVRIVISNKLRRSVNVSMTTLAMPNIPKRTQIDTPFDTGAPPPPPLRPQTVTRQLSETEELDTWLQDELKEGIPLDKTLQSVGVYPESLNTGGPLNCWTNDSPPSLVPKTRSHMSTQSSVLKMEIAGSIPSTIQETEDPPPPLTTVVPPRLKPAKSITELPAPVSKVLNVKRVHSSGSLDGKKPVLPRTPSSISYDSAKLTTGSKRPRNPSGKPLSRRPSTTMSNYTQQSPYAQPLVRSKPKPVSKVKVKPEETVDSNKEREREENEKLAAKERENKLRKENEELRERLAKLEAVGSPPSPPPVIQQEDTAPVREQPLNRTTRRRRNISSVCLIV